jgi:hypothetical protein
MRDFDPSAHDERAYEHEQGEGQETLQDGKRAFAKDQPAADPRRRDPGGDTQDRQRQTAILILVEDEDTALRRQHAEIEVERVAPAGDLIHLTVRHWHHRLVAGEFIRQPRIEIHAGRHKAQGLAHAGNLAPRADRGMGQGRQFPNIRKALQLLRAGLYL